MLEFRVLGPLEVRREGQPVEVHGAKRRAVLALLVLRADEGVRTDRLIEDLWGAVRPANAQGALHNHVSRLRSDLGEDVIATKPWGYVLRAAREAIDLRRFEKLVEEARTLPARERSARLAEALALWRGPALADLVNEPSLSGEIGHLDELRESVIEQRIDARLELGEHAEVVPDLERLIAEHPLRERLRGQLILALYASGRQADALETYRETRRALVEELGIEPSAELRELERAILRQDPSLAAAAVLARPDREDERLPPSRRRRPRSLLIVTAAALLLLLAGVAGAMLGTPRRGTHHASAARPRGASLVTVTPQTTSTGHAQSHERRPKADKRSPRHRGPPKRKHSNASASPKPKTTPLPVAVSTGKPNPPPPEPPPPPLPPPPPPPRPVLVHMADNFDDGVVNRDLWYPLLTGTGTTLTEQNRRLELSFASDAAAGPNGQGFNMMAAQVGTECRFVGDFDVSVSYDLVQWPAVNGVSVQLMAWFRYSIASVVRQSQRSGGETYTAWYRGGGTTVRTLDRRGGLRFQRKGSELVSYVRRAGAPWVRVASFRATGTPSIGLQALSTDESFADQPVLVAFDNFQVKAAEPVC